MKSSSKLGRFPMRKRNTIVGVVIAFVMLAPDAASANPSHNSQLLSNGSCSFDIYHNYNSSSGTADTENKGGCSEVYARIKANGTFTAWHVATNKAVAGSSGTGYSFDTSQGKARVIGGGIGSTWGMS